MDNSRSGIWVIVGLIALILIGSLIFAFRNKESSTATNTSSVAAENPSASNAPQVNQAEFSVTGGKFYFKPNEIRVKKGDTVIIHFTNVDGFHDFVIDEFNARTPQIGAGKSADVTFIADKTGSFEFYCSVGNHRQMGMKGTLIVE